MQPLDITAADGINVIALFLLQSSLFGGQVVSVLSPWSGSPGGRGWLKTNGHQPPAVNLRAEVDLEVLSVVKDVQESAALVKLGDAEQKVQKLDSSKNLLWNSEQIGPDSLNDNRMLG